MPFNGVEDEVEVQEVEFPGLLYTVIYSEVLELHAIGQFRVILRSGCTRHLWSSFLFLPWKEKSLISLKHFVSHCEIFHHG